MVAVLSAVPAEGQREGNDKKHDRAGDSQETGTGQTRRAVVFRGDDRFRARRGGIRFGRFGTIRA